MIFILFILLNFKQLFNSVKKTIELKMKKLIEDQWDALFILAHKSTHYYSSSIEAKTRVRWNCLYYLSIVAVIVRLFSCDKRFNIQHDAMVSDFMNDIIAVGIYWWRIECSDVFKVTFTMGSWFIQIDLQNSLRFLEIFIF